MIRENYGIEEILTHEERLKIEKRGDAVIAESYDTMIRTIEPITFREGKALLVSYIHYKPHGHLVSYPLSLLPDHIQSEFWEELKKLRENENKET